MIHLKIITPERTMIDEQVDQVTLPTQLGKITVLSNHVPLVANLKAGELLYKKDGKDNFFAVSGGFIEIKAKSEVMVLADTAEYGHEIDIDRANKAREEAQRIMSESYKDEQAFTDAAALLEKNLAKRKSGWPKNHPPKSNYTAWSSVSRTGSRARCSSQ